MCPAIDSWPETEEHTQKSASGAGLTLGLRSVRAPEACSQWNAVKVLHRLANNG